MKEDRLITMILACECVLMVWLLIGFGVFVLVTQ